MKLLYCNECNDVFALARSTRSCACGKTSAQYVTTLYAVYCGPGIPLGFDNASFMDAVAQQPSGNGWGKRFEAFVIPDGVSTFVEVLPSDYDGYCKQCTELTKGKG